MAPLPLAAPSLQRRLHLDDADDNAAADLRDNLSGLAAGDGWLWLAGDEGRSLHRLQADASGGYGHSSRVKLADFGLAGGKAEGESDLEGLALDGFQRRPAPLGGRMRWSVTPPAPRGSSAPTAGLDAAWS